MSTQFQICKTKLSEWLKPDKDLMRVFTAKIKEFEEYLLEEKNYIDRAYRLYGETKNEWRLWQMNRGKERAEGYEKQIRRFKYYHNACSSKPRVSAELNIEQAKEFPIGDLLAGKGWKTSNRQTYLCPLHNEKTPSFVWYIQNNSWYCFGCGQGGDVIDLYMKLHNVDFKSAVNKLV